MNFDPEQLSAKDCHSLLVCSVLPRPIAFVSTISADGIHNLAPFSYFTVMSTKPTVVGFGIGRRRDGGKKDTLVNVESTGDFVINMVTEELAQAMNQTSAEYPPHVDEFKEAGLTALSSDRVKSPRLGESPVNLECKLLQVMNFGEAPRISSFIVGEVLQVHLRDDIAVGCVAKGDRLKVIGRLGEDFYCRTCEMFEMKRPVL